MYYTVPIILYHTLNAEAESMLLNGSMKRSELNTTWNERIDQERKEQETGRIYSIKNSQHTRTFSTMKYFRSSSNVGEKGMRSAQILRVKEHHCFSFRQDVILCLV